MLKKIFVILCMLLFLHGSQIPKMTSANLNANSNLIKDVIELQEKGILKRGYFYNINMPIYEKDAAVMVEQIYNVANKKAPFVSEFSPINERFLENKLLIKRIERNFVYPNNMVGKYLARAEAAKSIIKAFNFNEDVNTNEFMDVSNNEHFFVPVMTLSKLNVIQDSNTGKYRPRDWITIAEFSSMIMAAMDVQSAINSNQLIYNYLIKEYIDTRKMYPILEQQIIEKINVYRKKNRISPLKYDEKLTQLAIIKVKDMVENDYFDHKSPTYNMAWDLAGVFNYEFVTLGENLARYFTNAEDLVDAWIASPTHNENLLKDSYRYIGIGIDEDAVGNFYFCNLFSGR